MYVLLNVQVCDRCAAQINHMDRQNELQQTIIIIVTTKCHVAILNLLSTIDFIIICRHDDIDHHNKQAKV